MYQRIDIRRWRQTFIAGDLHGCYDKLMQALGEHHFDPQTDLLICVGDLIDRGSQNLECLRLLDEPWFYCVCGNHEQMAFEGLGSGDTLLWEMNGGGWYFHLPPDSRGEARDRLLNCTALPLIIELVSEEWCGVVAHADYPASRYEWQKPVDRHQVVWNRERLHNSMKGKGDFIEGAQGFWFGHTPLNAPYDAWNQHYIDTGAVFGNELTLTRVL